MSRASLEQGELVGEVVVDGLALYPRSLGNVGYGGLSRTISCVELHCTLDDPLVRLLVALGSGLQVVLPSLAASHHLEENLPFLLTARLIIGYHAVN